MSAVDELTRWLEERGVGRHIEVVGRAKEGDVVYLVARTAYGEKLLREMEEARKRTTN